jgi:hypothetical protein
MRVPVNVCGYMQQCGLSVPPAIVDSFGVTVGGTDGANVAIVGTPDGVAVAAGTIHQNDGVGVGESVGDSVGDAVVSRSKMTERMAARSAGVSGVVRPINAVRRGESAGSGTQRPRWAASSTPTLSPRPPHEADAWYQTNESVAAT